MMSTKQILLVISTVTLLVVGVLSVLFASYQMYKGNMCKSETTVTTVKEVTSVASPSATTASPSASPTKIPFRPATKTVLPSVSPTVK